MSTMHICLLVVGFPVITFRVKGLVQAIQSGNTETVSVQTFFLLLAVGLFTVLWVYS